MPNQRSARPSRRRFLAKFAGVLAALALLLFLFPSWTPSIRDENGRIVTNSITSLERIELGGVKQSILIRGVNRKNPVLLLLHGGPGYPQIAYARRTQSELEKDFVVVNWDQRGSGKSYNWGMGTDDLPVSRLVDDTLELAEHLQKRFGQKRILLAGHSWGSQLGLWAVQKRPELFAAYIGIGQVADSPRGERVSYDYVLNEARTRGDQEALRDLEGIGPPPYRNPRADTTLERKWVIAYGGSERSSDSYGELIRGILWAPEYTWLDGLRLAVGNGISLRAIRPQTEGVNMSEAVPELQVPVYMGTGRYDYMTPGEVAYDYYEVLQAPFKEWMWFENSAHFPQLEEPERYAEWLRRIKLVINEGSSHR